MVNRPGYTTVLIFFLLALSCQPGADRWQQADISGVSINDIHIKRYEQVLFKIDPASLYKEINKLTEEFPVFLDVDLNDTLIIIELYDYLTDPYFIELAEAISQKYPDLAFLEKDFDRAFKHFIHYFPERPVPDIYSYISGMDIEYPVGYAYTDLIIALDMYLGKDYELYKQLGLPMYKIWRFEKANIVRDCFEEMAWFELRNIQPGETFLDRMVHEGKICYFLDAMLPQTPDSIKINYTSQQLEWCKKHESDLWKFIIENELLYSTDLQVINKFFNDGPFTRGFDGSPARLGTWMGWQIARSYMNRNLDTDLNVFLQNTDTKEILTNSGYKPFR